MHVTLNLLSEIPILNMLVMIKLNKHNKMRHFYYGKIYIIQKLSI
jgi:hypothetical protein